MLKKINFKKASFLIYGLGSTGKSVVNFFKKNKIKNYQVWDDQNKRLFKHQRPENLELALQNTNYIILSPGVNLQNSKNRKYLKKYKNKIITDIDLVFILKKFSKSIVVTGTNGKSTTCKILEHILKKNNYKIHLGGNIGTPILNLKIKKNSYLIIEASSFQLAYSKFICPDYAFILNISNDHLDWHGTMKNYIDSKFKIFNLQRKDQYSIINKKLRHIFLRKKFKGKLIIPQIHDYKKIKSKIKNAYLKLKINDENLSNVFILSKLLKIKKKFVLKSLNSFEGLPHRYEIFLEKKNCIFINDSKATSFEATKSALKNCENIYWIVGGLPKKNDNFTFGNSKKNIIRAYIIGKNTHFFKQQIKNKINFKVVKNLRKAISEIIKDIKISNINKKSILFSPASASYDQYLNFEKRGEEFKKLSKYYAKRL